MDADEREICEYLKAYSGQYISSKEICKRAGGKWRSREDPHWAIPILMRLVEQQILESDSNGHYRLLPERHDKKRQVWISPENKKLLEEGGKPFDDITKVPELRDLDLEEEE
jgi:hypothetical protein